jgi:iron complex transport system permease protein
VKPALRLLLLLVLAALALVVGIRLGAVPLGALEILRALRGLGDPTAVAIVQELRLPRSAQAALVGAALAASGATFQALLRNPLAEPYILGVSGGAAVGAVLAIVLGLTGTAWVLPLAAFGGALVAITLVLRIAASVGPALDTRVLLLAGVVVGAFFNACILLALTFADAETFRSAIFWMMGSFSGATWRGSAVLLLYLGPGLLVLLALARPLNLLAIGEETAAHLGTPVERTKRLAYGTASLLAAAAVAVSGMIGFVGLIVPHVIRLLWGSDHRFLIPASALLGASFLVLTDALARTATAPVELPVGVVTAFVGVPFFLWLLLRGGKREEGRGKSGPHPARQGSPPSPAGGRGEPAAPRPVGLGQEGTGAYSSLFPLPSSLTWSCSDLGFRYPGAERPALDGVSLGVRAGACTAVLGPNGSGKSTLLRLLLGTLDARRGEARFEGRPLAGWDRSELARRVGVVPQGEEIAFPLSVRELVAMGRYPFLGPWRREGEADRAAVERAMRRCDVEAFAARPISTLSGGERQRARVARALAQEPGVLALDEPTAALDIRHEMEIFELMRELSREGVTVLLVTHNLNLAARYADRLVLLDGGRVAAEGAPRDVLTGPLVERVYGWPVTIEPYPGPGPDAGAPQVVPLGARGAGRDVMPSSTRNLFQQRNS